MMMKSTALFLLLTACVDDFDLETHAMAELSDDGKQLSIVGCSSAWGTWCDAGPGAEMFVTLDGVRTHVRAEEPRHNTLTTASPRDRHVVVEVDGHVTDLVLPPPVVARAPAMVVRSAGPVAIDFERFPGMETKATLVTLCGDLFDLKWISVFDGTLDFAGTPDGTCSHFVRITQSSEQAVDDAALRVFANQSVDVEITSTP